METSLNKNSFFIRTFIFIFFVFIIFGCLYMPRVIEYFKQPDKSINVLSFVEMISPESIKQFEKQMGIPINITYFESNDELFTKLKINKGSGYDVLLVTDYMVDLLRKENYLREIDKTKLGNYKYLDQRFLSKYFDLGNKYSIPYIWTVFGLAYNKIFFGGELKNSSLSLLFDFQDRFKIAMPGSAREAVFLTGKYLFGRGYNLNDEQLEKIKELLIDQKKTVECYTSEKQDYLLYANIVPLAVCESSFVRKMHIDNERAKDKIGFTIPKEGSLVSIENFVILNSSDKHDELYTFIDFILSAETTALNVKLYGVNPVNTQSYSLIDPEYTSDRNYFPDEELMDKVGLLHNDIPLNKIDDLWLAVKAE